MDFLGKKREKELLLTKKVNRSERTDPNYIKASLLKIKKNCNSSMKLIVNSGVMLI